MKRRLPLLFAVAIAISSNAQQIVLEKNRTVNPMEIQSGDAVLPHVENKAIYRNPSSSDNKTVGKEILETTTYDLQTNVTVQDRIVRNSTGHISAAWTASHENSQDFTERGTGYAHFDPTQNTWEVSPNYPRIESNRCGWASMLYDGSGGEIIVSHSTATNVLKLNKRSTIGTGNWSEKDISTTNLTWNRAAMGGTDGNSLHIIALTDTLDTASFQQMYRALVYYRSQDAGSTFDIKDKILSGIDSSAYPGTQNTYFLSTINVDAYSIAARGNVVAFAIFNEFNDIILMKSTDNGSNWTKTIVHDFPFRNRHEFDFFGDSLSGNYNQTTDGSGSILIDDNDMVHLCFGRKQLKNVAEIRNWQYFLRTDSLGYWNESMGSNNWKYVGHFIGGKIAPNIDTVLSWGENVGKAFLSYPNMGIGSDGTIYIVYSGLNGQEAWEGNTTGLCLLRHIYLIKSKDGGNTWSDPVDLSPEEPSLNENIYPDMIREVDDKVRLIWQRDYFPSTYLQFLLFSSAPPAGVVRQNTNSQNEIVFMEVDTLLNVGIEKILNSLGESSVYPNPSGGQLDLSVKVLKDVTAQLDVTNLNGQVVYRYTNSQLKFGKNQIHLDLSHLQSGIYLINIRTEESILTEKIVLE